MATRTLEERQAEKLQAVADWFRDCKTLTLEKLPVGLIAALEAGAAALTNRGQEKFQRCECGHTKQMHPMGLSENILLVGRCVTCGCPQFNGASRQEN